MDKSGDYEAQAAVDMRTCTCFPGEGPVPCPRKFAYHDCWQAAVLDETQNMIVMLKGRDRSPAEQDLLDYLMRVRTALEFY
jgi:hypothetical protein